MQIAKLEALADVGVKYVVDFYERCDEVWAVSRSSAETLKSYGFRGDIIVMPNGMDLHDPEPEAAKEAGEKYALGEDPVLLFVGQMNWKKNIIRILEAGALLRKSGVKFTLVLAGQGPL